MTILEEIAAYKRKEAEENRFRNDIRELEKSKYFRRVSLSLSGSLLDSGKSGIIAEYKRKSPSAGIINDRARIEDVTTGYANAGAAALSVLTDSKYFGGDNNDLKKARELNSLPLLRKDFTVDEYQVVEAKSIGADVILLIAAILDIRTAKILAKLAASLNMQVILEIHKEKELDFINEHINIVGVNNRNLEDFSVNISASLELAEKIPSEFIKISESGITSPNDIKNLREHGYNGFLIGERFMKDDDPVKSFESFVKGIRIKWKEKL
jgi:indole-3-glycerol phosphate synthase